MKSKNSRRNLLKMELIKKIHYRNQIHISCHLFSPKSLRKWKYIFAAYLIHSPITDSHFERYKNA